MRHKTPRPLVVWWRRLPGTTARLLGAAGDRPVQALAAVVVALSLGPGAYLALTSMSDTSSSGPTASAGSTRAGQSELPQANDDPPAPEGRPSPRDSTDPGASVPPEAVAPTTGGSAGTLTAPSPESESPSAAASSAATPSAAPSTPSASPSLPSATAATTAEDVTPPNTSLSEESPEPDAGEFWLSADEPASFACSLDGAPYAPCSSHLRVSDLDPGWHVLAALATDAAGNTDPSPAEARWLATGSPEDE